ncbi:hypothetical protein [Nocardioides daphniae]|uniref:Saccharopine dehydrogenase n=1 Tax=Nocardioides daphniae TaxID=402297 RepID=A0A4P7UE25_9ACTN|nr:hypothetical protein [Nocardioides daphniae]QCC77781.1 hypothetical protein E2C04_12360 [Nocardioides daphniae]GGD28497.1 hypothetical protein GCM10007231_30010 [Nocardioides daphniae]
MSHVARVVVVGDGPWAAATVEELAGLADAVPVTSGEVEPALDRGADVVVLTGPDPGDRTLLACAERGLPVVDVHRSIASLDRAGELLADHAGARLVAADGWAGGVAALVAVGLARPEESVDLGSDHVEVDVLLDAGDEASDAWWERFAGLHRTFAVYDRGERRLVRGLDEAKLVRFAAGTRRARRVASPEQETLVENGHAGSVAVRVAFARRATDLWLALGVGSGAWRFLPRRWRRAALRPVRAVPAAGHEIWVTRVGESAAARVRVHDPRGRAHLVGASAATQVARLLDPTREPVPAGVSVPEQAPDLARDLDELRRRGVTFDVERRDLRPGTPA